MNRLRKISRVLSRASTLEEAHPGNGRSVREVQDGVRVRRRARQRSGNDRSLHHVRLPVQGAPAGGRHRRGDGQRPLAGQDRQRTAVHVRHAPRAPARHPGRTGVPERPAAARRGSGAASRVDQRARAVLSRSHVEPSAAPGGGARRRGAVGLPEALVHLVRGWGRARATLAGADRGVRPRAAGPGAAKGRYVAPSGGCRRRAAASCAGRRRPR